MTISNKNFEKLDKKLLEKEYITNGLSIYNIAKKYKCSYTATYNRVKKFGIKIKPKKEGVFNSQSIKLYLYDEYINKNRNTKDIAKELGVSYRYIQAKVRQFNFPRKCKNYDDLLTYDFLHHHYFILKKTSREIAKEFKLNSHVVVLSKIKKFNITVTKKNYMDISSSYISAIKNRAIKNRIDYKLETKYLWDLYIKQNKKCAISKIDIKFTTNGRNQCASLDRINPKIGYIEGNVQWLHKNINKMKLDFDQKTFIEYCKIITNNN